MINLSSDCGSCNPCGQCCCSPCVKDCYRIKSYSDSVFSRCGNCDDGSGNPVWDGTFPNYDPDSLGDCIWTASNSPEYVASIAGNLTDLGYTTGQGTDCKGAYDWLVYVGKDPNGCWELHVACGYTGEGGPCTVIWHGIKSEGSTPDGIYTRTGGCSAGPATIEIEECPGADSVSLPDCYRISGYIPGDLVGCPDCNTFGYPEWDGRFEWRGEGDLGCVWFSENDEEGDILVSIGGCTKEGQNSVSWQADICAWLIELSTFGGVETNIWRGTNPNYDPTAGVFTRIDGCDTTSSLTLEAC